MSTTVSRLVSSLASLTLIAGSVPAGAAPAPTTPPPTGTYTVTFPTASAPGTPFPRFASQSITATLANSLRTAQGDSRALLDWGRCPQLGADGMASELSLSHCIRLTLGTDTVQTAYMLVDLPCPAGNPASGCYGGYVIASRADGNLARDYAGGTTTTDRRSQVRLGYRRQLRSFATGELITTYVLPTTPVVVVDYHSETSLSRRAVDVTATAATGDVLFHDEWVAYAGSSGAAGSCDEQFDQAIADGQFYASVAASVVAGAIALGGTAAGISIAVTGGIAGIGTLGAGSALALAVGGAVGTASLAMSTGAYVGVKDIGTSWAMSDAIAARTKCRQAQMLEENPPTMPEVIGEMSEMTSGATDSGLSELSTEDTCDHTSESEGVVDGEYCWTECAEVYVDGECDLQCETVCTSE